MTGPLAWAADPLLLLINALAAYRLTRLWTRDSLPPLPQIRQAVLSRWGDKTWTELLVCDWCAGFWISAGVVAVASSPAEGVWLWLAVPLALSAVVGLIATRDE